MNDPAMVCVYKTGGDFNKHYVDMLFNGFVKHSGLENQHFYCLTDVPYVFDHSPYNVIPLQHDLPGWWSKLELFNIGAKGQRIVYMDLDTIIKGDISFLFTDDHPFSMLKDFNKKVDRLASGVMVFDVGEYQRLLNRVLENRTIMDLYDPKKGGKLGDQAYLEDYLGFQPTRLQSVYGDIAVSYKWADEAQKDGASIICYHGSPRPLQTNWSIY